MGLGVVVVWEGLGGDRAAGVVFMPLMEVESVSRSDEAIDGVLGRVTTSTEEARRTTPPIRDHLDLGVGDEFGDGEAIGIYERERGGGRLQEI